MKQLQCNFTTQEQSKRLLELGVPEWTADCYFRIDLYSSKIEMCFTKEDSLIYDYIPCWSVGRLIEIYEICFGGYFNSRYFGHTLMEDVLLKIEEQIDSIDFSKLEE